MVSQTVYDFIQRRISMSSYEREKQYVSLGNIINIFRVDQNMSMSEFSELSGLSKPYISMLERGINPSTQKPVAPSIGSFKKAARAMGVPLDDLIHAVSDNHPISFMSSPEEDTFGDVPPSQKEKTSRPTNTDKIRIFRYFARVAGCQVKSSGDIVSISSQDRMASMRKEDALKIELEIETYIRFMFEKIYRDYF